MPQMMLLVPRRQYACSRPARGWGSELDSWPLLQTGVGLQPMESSQTHLSGIALLRFNLYRALPGFLSFTARKPALKWS